MLSGCVVVGGSSGSSSNGAGLLLLIMPIFLLFTVFRIVRGSAGRRRPQPRFSGHGDSSPSLNMTRAELSVLADDVLRLEPQIVLKPEARNDYEAALHRYRVAQAALDDTTAPVDLVRVQRVVDEASYSMSRAKAILDGRKPPPPPDGLQQPGRHGEPAVVLDDRNEPRYVDSPASFQSGWFSFGPGLFGGLLMGSMLSGGFGWGGEEIDDGGDYGDGFGGDRFGGDGFGGDDFGGDF
jgi:hypothetical protein